MHLQPGVSAGIQEMRTPSSATSEGATPEGRNSREGLEVRGGDVANSGWTAGRTPGQESVEVVQLG